MFRVKAAAVVGCVSTLICAGAAQGALTPVLDCTTYRPETNTLTGVWGYRSDGAGDIPIGPDNFFSPGVLNRKQPTSFLAGLHLNLFETSIQVSASQPQITWFLAGNSQVLKAGPDPEGAGTVPQCAMAWRGDWQPGAADALYDVVAHDGGSWVAVDDPGMAEPGRDPVCRRLPARARRGRSVLRGLRALSVPSVLSDLLVLSIPRDRRAGPVPQARPAPRAQRATRAPWRPGAERGNRAPWTAGPPGDEDFFPSPITWSFSACGCRRIVDPHVTPSSVITIQYVGAAGGAPTSVSRQDDGSFVATGSPGHSFRYVVYDEVGPW